MKRWEWEKGMWRGEGGGLREKEGNRGEEGIRVVVKHVYSWFLMTKISSVTAFRLSSGDRSSGQLVCVCLV